MDAENRKVGFKKQKTSVLGLILRKQTLREIHQCHPLSRMTSQAKPVLFFMISHPFAFNRRIYNSEWEEIKLKIALYYSATMI